MDLCSRSSALVAFLVACLTHCSGGRVEASDSPSVAQEVFGATLAERVCGAMRSCCENNGFVDEHRQCAATLGPRLQVKLDELLLKEPRPVYDPVRAGRCVAKYARRYAQCVPTDDDVNLETDEDCATFVRGTTKPGEPCGDSYECAGLATCARTGRSTTGLCVAMKSHASVGDDCGADSRPIDPKKTYASCGAKLHCDEASGRCVERGARGAACGTATQPPCAKGNHCSAGVCAPLPSLGHVCETACADGASCSPVTRSCEALAAPGASCTQGQTACRYGCDATSGRCQSSPVSRFACAGQKLE